MKSYPSISRSISPSLDITAFDKLDGSNIRAEWSKKRGFYKFGSRKCMIDETHESLGKSVYLIKEHMADKLNAIFRNRRIFKTTPRSVICFFEYFGPNSFAGRHAKNDKMQVALIDVNVHKKGIMHPNEFIDTFGDLNIAQPLYFGKANNEFVDSVREGRLKGMTFEGVVCKAPRRKGHSPIMFKIKSNAWLRKLKNYCGADNKLYNKLV